jgi:hypothetical protein
MQNNDSLKRTFIALLEAGTGAPIRYFRDDEDGRDEAIEAQAAHGGTVARLTVAVLNTEIIEDGSDLVPGSEWTRATAELD